MAQTPEADLAQMLMPPFQQNYQSMMIGGIDIFAQADDIVEQFYTNLSQYIVAQTNAVINQSKTKDEVRNKLQSVLNKGLDGKIKNTLKDNLLLAHFSDNVDVFQMNGFNMLKLQEIDNNIPQFSRAKEAMAGVLRMAEKYNQLTTRE